MAGRKNTDPLTLPPNAPFSLRLWYIVQKRGLTQRRAAEICDITPNTMCNYMGGRHEPTVTVLVNIARGLNVSLDWLCGLREEEYDR